MRFESLRERKDQKKSLDARQLFRYSRNEEASIAEQSPKIKADSFLISEIGAIITSEPDIKRRRFYLGYWRHDYLL
jgi:hypothetical protein